MQPESCIVCMSIHTHISFTKELLISFSPGAGMYNPCGGPFKKHSLSCKFCRVLGGPGHGRLCMVGVPCPACMSLCFTQKPASTPKPNPRKVADHGHSSLQLLMAAYVGQDPTSAGGYMVLSHCSPVRPSNMKSTTSHVHSQDGTASRQLWALG